MSNVVEIDYTNWRGERSVRRVHVFGIVFKSTEWHPEPQYLLWAVDLSKRAERYFAMRDIHSWIEHQKTEADVDALKAWTHGQ